MSNGADQNAGVVKLSGVNMNTDELRDDCFRQCRDYPGATGCEVIYDTFLGINQGCYVHTADIARGNNADSHNCWVFSKCSGN